MSFLAYLFCLGDDKMWVFETLNFVFNDFYEFLDKFMSSNLATIISYLFFVMILGVVGTITTLITVQIVKFFHELF